MIFLLFVFAVLCVAVTQTFKCIILFFIFYSTFSDPDYRCNTFEHSDNRFVFFPFFFLHGVQHMTGNLLCLTFQFSDKFGSEGTALCSYNG